MLILPFRLPWKAEVPVKVPKGYIIRPNGNRDVVGVRPDIEIKDYLIDDKDEILEGLLRLQGGSTVY